MEEKKTIKVNLVTVLLILAIIGLVVMGVFMYKIINDKSAEENKAAELQSQVDTLKATISQLQGKIETNSTVNNNTDKKNDNISFSEEQVKKAISEYLELYANANCGTPLDTLKEKGKISYDSSKNTMNTSNGEITTNVKFADYKKAMLNYVSESEFEKNWTSKIGLKEDSNGYVTHGQLGGGLRTYTINTIAKTGNLTYSVKATSMVENDSTTKSNESFTVVLKSYDGNCVIDSLK